MLCLIFDLYVINQIGCGIWLLLENTKKVNHLLDLPNAKTHLSLWKADLGEEGSFDEAIEGCTGVFHVATPMDFESKDPEVTSYLLCFLLLVINKYKYDQW